MPMALFPEKHISSIYFPYVLLETKKIDPIIKNVLLQ